MEKLEEQLRKSMVKILFVSTIVALLFDVIVMISIIHSNSLSMSLTEYILKRICLPFLINIASSFTAMIVIKSERFSSDMKNMTCSVALCTMAGSLAVFNSYYVQLWIVPSMVLLFSSLFHNKKINTVIFRYSCIIVVIATLYVSSERPGTFPSYMRRCIIAEGITIIVSLIAEQVQKYQMSVRNLIMDAYKKEEKFRKKLEYDTLTQVHSRVYINEIINGLFGLKDRDVPMGFAILDLDNFKSVNDTYGHGNGDKVLSTLGEVLNKYASEDIIVGRFGGEEFIIIFKGEEQGKDFDTLDKIREEFAGSSFDFMDRKVSFSSGLVNCTSGVLYEKVFNEADKALYVSKTQGKNMITVKNI